MNIKKFLSHFFTPQETNNYKARSLHVDFLSFYLIGAILLAFTVKGIGPYFNNVLGFATDITVDKLFQLTNEERVKDSLPPLQYNQQLAEAAKKKAADMFAKNYWSHYAPDGTTPWEFILGSGYHYEYAGENLAKNFLFSDGVVTAWMNSPTHRANILRKDYTEVGYAIANGMLNGEETTLVVQMFGKPLVATSADIHASQPAKAMPLPTAVPEPVKQNGDAVLGKDTAKPKATLLPFSFDATYVFMFFFTATLIADFYLASRLNLVKLGGKHVAHLIFLGFIILSIVFIIKNGAIL